MKTTRCFAAVFYFVLSSVILADLPATKIDAGQNPRIDGSIVVWESTSSQSTINYCDLSQIPLTGQSLTGTADRYTPFVSGSLVVWRDYRNQWTTGFDIYGYNFNDPSGGEFSICVATGTQSMPAISGNRVVWEDRRNGTHLLIYTTVLPDTGGQLIANSTAGQFTPAVSGNVVVWRDDRNSQKQIYYCDLSNTTWNAAPLYSQSYEQWRPDISGSRVVWVARENDVSVGIYVFDISQNQIIWSYSKSGVDNPRVDGEVVVWQEPHPQQSSVNNIRAYHLGRGQFYDIATTIDNDVNPDVSGNTVVWQRNGMYGADIYYAVIPTPTEVSVVAPAAGFVGIAGNVAQIQWSLTSGEAPAAVALQFSANDGATWQTIAASVPFSSSAYDWTMPQVTSQLCRVRVCDPSNLTPYGISGQFTVYICDARLTADVNRDCVVNLSDFAEIVNQWLRCGNPLDPQCEW